MKYLIMLIASVLITNFAFAQKIILAQVEINEQTDNAFFSQTKSLIKLTREEKGCVSFNINSVSQKPNAMVIFEIFIDETAFKNHLKQYYVVEWFKMLNKIKKTELVITELKTLNLKK